MKCKHSRYGVIIEAKAKTDQRKPPKTVKWCLIQGHNQQGSQEMHQGKHQILVWLTSKIEERNWAFQIIIGEAKREAKRAVI